MYLLILLSCFLAGATLLYYYRQWLLNKLLSYAMKQVLHSSLTSKLSLPAIGFTQLTNNSAQITYSRFDRQYHVYLPYNLLQVLQMQEVRASAIRENEVIDITQQAGIPYLVSADSLQALRLEFTNSEGQVVTFEGEKIPYYPKFNE